MKAKLEFDLPEEREEFNDALNGTKYLCQIEEVWIKVFRKRLKYEDLSENDYKLIQKMADEFHKIRNEDY